MASSSVSGTGRKRRSRLERAGARIAMALTLACTACSPSSITDSLFGSNTPAPGQPGYVKGFLGGVVADEPRAALIGRDVLSSGGNAADAAVAVGLALAVTLPSRASLGSGGACLAYASDAKSVNNGVPEAVLFTPTPPRVAGPNADRPAAVPMLARGMFLLNARYGSRPIEVPLARAEELARFGIQISRALARDIAVVATPLFADPAARAVFSHDGQMLTEGQQLTQTELASTLAQIRVSGVGDLYQGALGRRIVDGSASIGGPLQLSDLRAALPRLAPPLTLDAGRDKVAFLPPPADGGLAAGAAFQVLQADPAASGAAAARALAAAALFRRGGMTADEVLATRSLPAAALPPLPASTSFATLDKNGNAVVCALTMDNLFGTGRMFPGTGVVAAASPSSVPPPLLSAALAWNSNVHGFRAEVGGSGQAGAPMAVAWVLYNTLRSGVPLASPPPDPGRANVIACGRYLPSEAGTCGWATDPREPGLAVGGS